MLMISQSVEYILLVIYAIILCIVLIIYKIIEIGLRRNITY